MNDLEILVEEFLNKVGYDRENINVREWAMDKDIDYNAFITLLKREVANGSIFVLDSDAESHELPACSFITIDGDMLYFDERMCEVILCESRFFNTFLSVA